MVAAPLDGSDKTAQTKPLEDKMHGEEAHADEEIPIARDDEQVAQQPAADSPPPKRATASRATAKEPSPHAEEEAQLPATMSRPHHSP